MHIDQKNLEEEVLQQIDQLTDTEIDEVISYAQSVFDDPTSVDLFVND